MPSGRDQIVPLLRPDDDSDMEESEMVTYLGVYMSDRDAELVRLGFLDLETVRYADYVAKGLYYVIEIRGSKFHLPTRKYVRYQVKYYYNLSSSIMSSFSTVIKRGVIAVVVIYVFIYVRNHDYDLWRIMEDVHNFFMIIIPNYIYSWNPFELTNRCGCCHEIDLMNVQSDDSNKRGGSNIIINHGGIGGQGSETDHDRRRSELKWTYDHDAPASSMIEKVKVDSSKQSCRIPNFFLGLLCHCFAEVCGDADDYDKLHKVADYLLGVVTLNIRYIINELLSELENLRSEDSKHNSRI